MVNLLCKIRHKWKYQKIGHPKNWSRRCQRCLKKQVTVYDMAYGNTEWVDKGL